MTDPCLAQIVIVLPNVIVEPLKLPSQFTKLIVDVGLQQFAKIVYVLHALLSVGVGVGVLVFVGVIVGVAVFVGVIVGVGVDVVVTVGVGVG
jgi:hypothetical protein